jgi:hypothetical protein
VEIFSDSVGQMTFGERAAMEGVLSQRKPRLAISIGSAEGGGLERIDAHAEEVRSLDSTFPQVLAQLAEEGRNIDFVFVDGAQPGDGVRRDLDELLASPAVTDTLILIHGSMNEQIRTGLDAVRYTAHPKVAHVNLDFVPGYMLRSPGRRYELQGGLGLVIVDAARTAYFPDAPVVEERYYQAGRLYPRIRDLVAAAERNEPASPEEAREQRALAEELTAVREERERYKAMSDTVTRSLSWKVTAPLRAATRGARRALAKARRRVAAGG